MGFPTYVPIASYMGPRGVTAFPSQIGGRLGPLYINGLRGPGQGLVRILLGRIVGMRYVYGPSWAIAGQGVW
jgi:hypothetical protein